MNDYNDGKIHVWNGGECPVHPKSEVMVYFHDGLLHWGVAGSLSWKHSNRDSDIIKLQVVEPYVEPKAIWVNEYANGGYLAYPSENVAKAGNNSKATRIAVKYVEAKE